MRWELKFLGGTDIFNEGARLQMTIIFRQFWDS